MMDRPIPDNKTQVSAEGDASQRTRRDSLFLMARLQIVGDETVRDVRIRNLSEGGLMAEFKQVLVPGTRVLLTVRGIGDVPGRVAWCTDGRLGIAFDVPIDPRLARKPVGAGDQTPIYAKSVVTVAPRT